MTLQDEHMRILDLVESGKISAEEAARLLIAFTADEENNDDDLLVADSWMGDELSPDAQPLIAEFNAEVTPNDIEDPDLEYTEAQSSEEAATGHPAVPPEMRKWRRYWIVPFTIALALLVLSVTWMYQTFSSSGYGFWFFCSWIPFLLSVAVVAFAWQSRSVPWLHLRVEQGADEWPKRIAFSFPLPLGLAGWMLGAFGHRIPGLRESKIDLSRMPDLLTALKNYTSPDTPMYIEVDDDEDGDRVFIYIG